MHVLMLATIFPYPPTHGGGLRVWNVFRQVARRHRVTFLGMYLPAERPTVESVALMEQAGARVILVERPCDLPFRLANAVRSFIGSWPYTIANFRFARFEEAMRNAIGAGKVDLVHAHCLHTAQYCPLFGTAARYYDCQNINAVLWRRYAETQRNPLRRYFALRQARLLDRLEPRVHQMFDATTFCSDLERDYARERSPEAALFTSPNGVDCAFFTPRDKPEEPHSLVFTASMDAPQNSDAAEYCVRELLPPILKRYPGAKLYLVGRKPPAQLRALASEQVIVTGSVDDVRPYIARGAVYVVPLRIGGGTRLKILEAMAMGKAIVSTTVGAEGIDCAHDKDILLADGPDAFARAVGRLFDHPDERRRMGEAARQRVLAQYGWDGIGDRVEEYYRQAVRNAQRRVKEGRP